VKIASLENNVKSSAESLHIAVQPNSADYPKKHTKPWRTKALWLELTKLGEAW
jgi:hypothetical protein